MANPNPNPGATVVVRVKAKKSDGTYWDLTGSTIRTEIAGSEVDTQTATVIVVDNYTRDLVVSTTQTEAAAGSQIRLRYWMAPADSFETVGGETVIDVRAA